MLRVTPPLPPSYPVEVQYPSSKADAEHFEWTTTAKTGAEVNAACIEIHNSFIYL
jgi:hypothetical protein